jgi:hypothetical protein
VSLPKPVPQAFQHPEHAFSRKTHFHDRLVTSCTGGRNLAGCVKTGTRFKNKRSACQWMAPITLAVIHG